MFSGVLTCCASHKGRAGGGAEGLEGVANAQRRRQPCSLLIAGCSNRSRQSGQQACDSCAPLLKLPASPASPKETLTLLKMSWLLVAKERERAGNSVRAAACSQNKFRGQRLCPTVQPTLHHRPCRPGRSGPAPSAPAPLLRPTPAPQSSHEPSIAHLDGWQAAGAGLLPHQGGEPEQALCCAPHDRRLSGYGTSNTAPAAGPDQGAQGCGARGQGRGCEVHRNPKAWSCLQISQAIEPRSWHSWGPKEDLGMPRVGGTQGVLRTAVWCK